jgi:hypothetical protein
MTTTVTVTTHDWPVEVQSFPLNDRVPVEGADWSTIGKVEPNSSGSFVVHSGVDVLIREQPSAAEAAAAAEQAT